MIRKNTDLAKILFILIILSGSLLRFINLGSKSLWYDEALTWQESRLPFFELIREVNIWEGNPFLFPFIIRIMPRFGDSEFALRFLPGIFGILSLFAIYFLAKKYMAPRLALISALLLSLSSLQVDKSQELRAYSSVVFLAIMIYFYYFRFLEEKKIWFLSAAVVMSIISMFLHYSYLIIFLALNALFALEAKNAQASQIKRWVLMQAILLFCLSMLWNVNLSHQIQRFTAYRSISVPFLNQNYPRILSLAEYLRFFGVNTWKLFDYFFADNTEISLLLFVFFILGFTALLRDKNNVRPARFILIAIFINVALAVLGKYPYGALRHCIYLSPLYYLIVAKGFEPLSGKSKLNKVLFGVSIVLIIYTGLTNIGRYYAAGRPTEAKSLIVYLNNHVRPDEKIYVNAAATYVFPYYYAGDLALCLFGTVWDNSRQEAEDIASEIEDSFRDVKKGWILAMMQDRLEITRGLLAKRWSFDRIIVNQSGDVRLFHIIRKN